MQGANQSYSFIVKNPQISSLKADSFIKITRNSMGLRGEEFNSKKHKVKILTVGGSTTECIILSDGTTWPDLLQKKFVDSDVWVGNGGVNGQSTFGHIPYLRDHYLKLKPDIVIFLIGANELNKYYLNNQGQPAYDFGREEPYQYNKLFPNSAPSSSEEVTTTLGQVFWHKVYEYKNYSKILLNIIELRSRKLTEKYNLGHVHNVDLINNKHIQQAEILDQNYEFEVDLKKLKTLKVNPDRLKNELKKQVDHRSMVRANIETLINISLENNIIPVFVTQPALFGPQIDSRTKVNLGTMILQAGNALVGPGFSGNEMWSMQEVYNDITRDLAAKRNVPLIDLASLMPKDSLYYYDYVHFSRPGAEKVADILYRPVCKVVKSNLLADKNCSGD